MSKLYEGDVVAWAFEQAALLRSGEFDRIDALNIAEEIEAVARSEQRELASRLVILLCHLLKWQFQPARRSQSWQRTMRDQRAAIASCLAEMPSLKPLVDDEDGFPRPSTTQCGSHLSKLAWMNFPTLALGPSSKSSTPTSGPAEI